MTDDPIVDEVRRAREAYFKEFNYDLNAMCKDLARRTKEWRKAGGKVVSLPPRRVQPRPLSAKKAG
jgi:hypothetical protein